MSDYDELKDRYDSLSTSVRTACKGSGCLNAHELRVALDQARADVANERMARDNADSARLAMRDELDRANSQLAVLRAEVRAARFWKNWTPDYSMCQYEAMEYWDKASDATDAAKALEGT